MARLWMAVVCGFLVVAAGMAENTPPQPTAILWFNQTLDHFPSADDAPRIFRQRYLIYDAHYKAGGPVFLCPGGESSVFSGYTHNGFMWQLGEPLNALYLFPEHRFYGETLPAGPTASYEKDTIKYLTIEQALEDYVIILRAVRKQYNVSDDIPTITFGGSYPGELAAFLRVAYPSDVLGALAASAPLRYHAGIKPAVPSGAFFKAVTEDMGMVDPRCPWLVQRAFTELYSLAASADGRAEASRRLALCSPLADGAAALRLLVLWAENAFASMGMADYPYSISGMAADPFDLACSAMRAPSASLLENLRDAIGVNYNYSAPVPCFNVTAEYYPCADITGCGGGVGDPDALSWDYQSCTQIVSNVDTNNVTDMFPPAPYNFDAVVAYCAKRWGTKPDPLAIPHKYPIDPKKTSNIIFSNGLLDPWLPGGILSNLSDSLIAITIDGAAHHLDLHGDDPSDPPAVRQARAQETAIIRGWLGM